MKQYYAQFVRVTAKPGTYDELLQTLQHFSESSELLKPAAGCIYYLIGATEEPNVVWVSELWTSKEAKDAVAANPESARAMKEIFIPLVESMGKPTVLTIVGGAGIQ